MTEKILKDPADVTDYIEQVRRLADENRSSFSFLPASAYTEAAMKGHLWIAIDSRTKKLRAYMFFGGTFPHLKIFQIYVCPEFRSAGLAGKLVGILKGYGEENSWLTIRSRVASDLKANKFWQRSGFRIVRQIPGKSKRTINVYELELDVPSLFGRRQFSGAASGDDGSQIAYARPLLPTPSYVIDLNVFFDAVRQRDAGESAFIFSSGLSGEIRVLVTAEFRKELKRRSPDLSADPVLEFARTLPTLPEVSTKKLAHLIKDLKATLSVADTKGRKWAANEQSDLVHLESCIHHKAFGFVTRDAKILRHCETLLEKYKLRVISPLDLSESFGEVETYRPELSVALGQEEIRVSTLDDGIDMAAENFLRKLGINETTISYCLSPGTTQSPRTRLVVRTQDGIVAIASWEDKVGFAGNSQAYLYVEEENPVSEKAIDHLLESMINRGNFGQMFSFDLRTGLGQIRTRELAIKRGFQPVRDEAGDALNCLRKVSFRGVVTKDDWLSLKKDFKEATDLDLPQRMPTYEETTNTGIVLVGKDRSSPLTLSLFQFETLISPGSLICPGRTGVIIPIKGKYANELLGTGFQTSFLPGQEAALRWERAYFSGVGKHKVLKRGTIIVFYISGQQKGAVALARATFSDKLTTTQAVLNLRRQGVLSEKEISQQANRQGELTVTTFDNLFLFPRSISFQSLKQMGCVGGANLITTQRLSHEALSAIVGRAFG